MAEPTLLHNFFSSMETDLKLSEQIKVTDPANSRQIELEEKQKQYFSVFRTLRPLLNSPMTSLMLLEKSTRDSPTFSLNLAVDQYIA